MFGFLEYFNLLEHDFEVGQSVTVKVGGHKGKITSIDNYGSDDEVYNVEIDGKVFKYKPEALEEGTLNKLKRKFVPGAGRKEAEERRKDNAFSYHLDKRDGLENDHSAQVSKRAAKRYGKIANGKHPFKEQIVDEALLVKASNLVHNIMKNHHHKKAVKTGTKKLIAQADGDKEKFDKASKASGEHWLKFAKHKAAIKKD